MLDKFLIDITSVLFYNLQHKKNREKTCFLKNCVYLCAHRSNIDWPLKAKDTTTRKAFGILFALNRQVILFYLALEFIRDILMTYSRRMLLSYLIGVQPLLIYGAVVQMQNYSPVK